MTATTATTTVQTPRPAVRGRRLAAVCIAGVAAIGTVTVATRLSSSDTTADPSAAHARVAQAVARPAGMPDGVWNQLNGVAPLAAVSPLAVAEVVRPAGMPDGVWSEVSGASGEVDAVRPAGMPDGVWAAINP
jgi:hypothetical protein